MVESIKLFCTSIEASRERKGIRERGKKVSLMDRVKEKGKARGTEKGKQVIMMKGVREYGDVRGMAKATEVSMMAEGRKEERAGL